MKTPNLVRTVRRWCDVRTPEEQKTLEKTIRIAKDRTRNMIRAWAGGDESLSVLAASAYMQGLNDMVESVEQIRQRRGPNPDFGNERCTD
jgi:uncharacterized protein (DUF3084 family)